MTSAFFLCIAVTLVSPAVDIDDPGLADQLRFAAVHHVTDVEKLSDERIAELREIAFKAIKSKSPENRWAACLYLKHFGTARATPVQEKMLEDKVDRVSAEAANGLAQPGNYRSLPALLSAFKRNGDETKPNCVQAVGIIGGKQAELTLDKMQKHAEKAGHVNDLDAINKARAFMKQRGF